jgi:hypothetical protein
MDTTAHSTARPERREGCGLALTVLVDAIRCLTGRVGPDRGDTISRARAWIISRDASWPFAFESICERLGIDPGALRIRLLNAPTASAPSSRRERRGALESELISMIGAGARLATVGRRLGVSVPAHSSLSDRLARRDRCAGGR